MKKLRLQGLFAGCLFLVSILTALGATPGENSSQPARPIPYVPSNHDTVKDMLWMAEVGTNDVVYDLGSGDGRVVIAAVRDFHARKAVGIEIEPKLVRESQEKAAQAGVADRVEFIQGNLFTNDISAASVVVLYLGHSHNIDLRGKIVRSLKPGARIVSHQFGMGEWPADKVLDVRTPILGMYGEMMNPFFKNPDVPHYVGDLNRATHDRVSLWVVPAPVAGVWRGNITLPSGIHELKLTLQQRLAGVDGSVDVTGATNFTGSVQADLWGSHLRFHCYAGKNYMAAIHIFFEGDAQGDELQGTLWINQGQERREGLWVGRREKADITGTWQWKGLKETPVQLKVDRHDGKLNVSYLDTNRSVPMYVDAKKLEPVPDFYDFGGGFYFTLLLGQEKGGGLRLGPDDGWVIGECVVTNNALNGRIAFFSGGDFGPNSFGTDKPKSEKQAWRKWEAKR